MQKKYKSSYKQTIPDDTLVYWRKLKRKGDAEQLATLLGISISASGRMLSKGYLPEESKNDRIEAVNSFFRLRYEMEHQSKTVFEAVEVPEIASKGIKRDLADRLHKTVKELNEIKKEIAKL